MRSSRKEFRVVNWDETVASQCRWSEYAKELINDWDILWENSEAGWQGGAQILAFKNGQLRYLDWSYGSCSGCDVYENMKADDVRKEFKNNVMMHFNNVDIFCNWLKMLKGTGDYKYGGFIDALSSVFKDKNADWMNDPTKLEAKINTFTLLRN